MFWFNNIFFISDEQLEDTLDLEIISFLGRVFFWIVRRLRISITRVIFYIGASIMFSTLLAYILPSETPSPNSNTIIVNTKDIKQECDAPDYVLM